jgi:SAM-dependent methyltransferase
MTEPARLWSGEFGNRYTERNIEFNDVFRTELWDMLLPAACTSVLEVGANAGQNLQAIARKRAVDFYATDINPGNVERLAATGLVRNANLRCEPAHKLSFPDSIADLAFTRGVLIHIPAGELIASMREIHRCAGKWIICGEYCAGSRNEEMIVSENYPPGTCWRRDYGSLWLDNFPDLRLVGEPLFCWWRTTGEDNLTYWRFEKGAERKH